MKIAVLVLLGVCAVMSAPSSERGPDPMLAELLAGAAEQGPRLGRQAQEPMSPLSQLLQDALAVSYNFMSP